MLLNRERAQNYMEKNDIDVLVAHTPENVFYSSDVFNGSQWLNYYNSDMYVAIPRDPEVETWMILPASAGGQTWIKDLRTYGPPTYTLKNKKEMVVPFEDAEYIGGDAEPSDILEVTLEEKGLAEKRIVFDELSLPLHRKLSGRLPKATVSMSSSIFKAIRMVKTEEEIERLTRVVKITEEALRVMFDAIRPGVAVREIADAIKQTAIQESAIPELLIPLGGPNLQGGDYTLKNGDLFFADIGLRHQGYLSDFGRTAFMGSPPRQVERYYEAVLKGEEEAIKAMRPGVKASEIFKIAVETVRDEGIPHYSRGGCGHGIGAGFDLPLIGPGDNTPLEENMVLEVETPYREMGFGGFMLEDTIIVKRGGARFLTEIDRGLRII
jgi:Xaa-Pro aminopeptidase